MSILAITGFGIAAVVLLVVVRHERPEMAVLLSAAVAAVLFGVIFSRIWAVIEVINQLAARARVDPTFLAVVLRVVGIAYITEFGAQVCRDAGEASVADKVELGGKVLMMVVAVPVLASIVDLVVRLAGG